MGIFGGTGASRDAAHGKTIIACGCRIQGELSTPGSVLLDGELDGSITDAASVSISAQGRMQGVIRAENITVAGHFEGEIYCLALDLLSQGHVVGRIHCEHLVVEKGGILDGQCTQMKYESTAQAALPKPSAEPAAISSQA